jgi:hypothetical protein
MKFRVWKRTQKFVIWRVRDWVHLVRRPLFGLLYQPRMIDDGDCGAIDGMRIGRGNRSTRRKPDPGSKPGRRGGKPAITAWAMARPFRSDELLPFYENVFCSLLLMNEMFGREIRTFWFRCETTSNFHATRIWILVQWKCSLPLTRRTTDFHRKFRRNAASGHISIPIRTHITTCFLVFKEQKSVLLIRSNYRCFKWCNRRRRREYLNLMDWSPPSFCETGDERSLSLKATDVLTEWTILKWSRKILYTVIETLR